jgi:hypothetical protein
MRRALYIEAYGDNVLFIFLIGLTRGTDGHLRLRFQRSACVRHSPSRAPFWLLPSS